MRFIFLLFIKIYVLNSPNDISHEISLNMRKKICFKNLIICIKYYIFNIYFYS